MLIEPRYESPLPGHARASPLVFHLTPGEAADSGQQQLARNPIASRRLTFVCFRSSTRRRFLLQFVLIVIDSGTDEIL
jgi:hypothetical protein